MKFKIQASYMTYLSCKIEAGSAEEAKAIADELDGGMFKVDALGDWSIDSVEPSSNCLTVD